MNPATMQRAPLLLPAAAFLAGCIAQAHGYAVIAVCIGIALATVRPSIAAGCFGGVIIGLVHGHPSVIEREFPTARYSGSVVGDVLADDTGVRFPFAVAGIGTLRAFAHVHILAGERLVVRARIAPLDEPRNPGEPSARAIGLDDGVVGEITIAAVLDRRPPDLHDARVWMPIVREWAAHRIRENVPEPQATILAGALWGERGTLPQSVRDDFQATGTVHVLVTAGLHLGVVAALTAGIFSLLRLPRIGAALGTIPIVYAYAWLSGWHLPSQRAAVMIAVALLARAFGARALTLNTLAIAAIVVAACWPVAVESASFALSFSCVTAIVLFAEPIAARLHSLRLPDPIAETLALTVATQIGVWPLTAAIFFTLAPYAILANAVVVPLVGLTMTIGLATLGTHPIVTLSAVFARWDTWLLTFVLATTHTLAALPGAHVTIAPPPLWAIALYDAATIGAAVLLRSRPRTAASLVLTACAGVVLVANIHPDTGFSITALDVGQGDGIVVRTPHGHTILIDAGGRLERGPTIDGRSPAERSAERVVIPYLRRAGITDVDLLVLTHPHGDHVGGCLGIVTQFRVREIFDSGQSYSGRAYADCKRVAAERHVPIRTVRRGLRWATDDGVSLDILAPTNSPLVDTGDDVNENSIVARLTCARTGAPFTALFMGDAGMAREFDLIEHHVNLHADLLKIGHHGSRYASTPAFIDAVRPRFAIISVGRHNLFGHPASATIETLRSAGASIFRTDLCGAVTITSGTRESFPTNTMLRCR